MKKIINYIKRLLGVTDLERTIKELNIELEYKSKIIERLILNSNNLKKEVLNLNNQFEMNNRISADISMKDTNYIILSGKWRGKDYVNINQVYNDEMGDFIKEFKERFRGREFKLDAPYGFCLKERGE